MEASSSVVVKVKYADMLRRFSVRIVDEELDFTVDGLREKIRSLFLFPADSELILTYIDEDGDVVTLVDDEDLRDVVKQALNPLRITVKLCDEKDGLGPHYSSGSSTPLRSPSVQRSSQNLSSGFSEIPKSVQEPSHETSDFASKSSHPGPGMTEGKKLRHLKPSLAQILGTLQDPLRDTILKLSTDLASKSSTSAPGVPDLVEYFSKVGLSYLDHLSSLQPNVQPSSQGSVPENSSVAGETKDLGKQSKVDAATSMDSASSRAEEQSIERNESSTKPHPGATTEINEGKHGKVKETSSVRTSSFDDMALAVDSRTISIGKKEKLRKEKAKKEKAKKIGESYSSEKSHMITSNLPPVSNNDSLAGNMPSAASNVPSGKEVNLSYEPRFETNFGNSSAPDLVKANPLDGRNKAVSFGGLGSSRGSIWAPNTGSPNFLSSAFGSSFTYDCPVTGVRLGSTAAAPPHHASEAFSHMRCNYQNDIGGVIFHRGVRCDGCGVYPITGPRFKSKVKVNYDLCSICFSQMGNETDYTQMDRPAVNGPQMPLKNGAPAMRQVVRNFRSGAYKLDSRFIQDVNIMDGTIMAPLTPFTKIWRMRNSGTLMWPQKTQLVWIGGDKLSSVLSVEVEIPAGGVSVDHEIDVAVDFTAPELPGRYVSYWRMASPSGQKFGQRVWALIQVDASVEETRRESVRGLNLNLPPSSSGLTGTEMIDMDLESVMEDNLPEPYNSKKTVENVKPAVELQPNMEHEMKFPINDSLLVGDGASSSVPSAAPSVSYPVINLSDVATIFSPLSESPVVVPVPLPPAPVISSQPPAEGLQRNNNEVEEELLKELDEMGFKQVDLNKKVLRTHDYDLEQAVDDLCGVAEWDPILEELEEMGFHDTEMNKMLLKKNNGSIKRVVMELIAEGLL